MISRREIVLGGALVVMFGGIPLCACRAQTSPSRAFGCCVAPSEAKNLFLRADQGSLTLPDRDHLRFTSGSDMFDYAMAKTLAHISRLTQTTPAFAFFNEVAEKNAFATDVPMLRRADSTILFGKKLLVDLFQTFGSQRGPAVTSICAHEFGHIVAYKRNLATKLMPDIHKPFRSEQFADYFAGWYAGQRQKADKGFPGAVFVRTLSSLSGTERGSHGTATDRTQAVTEGFKSSVERNLPLDDAIGEGVSYAIAQPET